MGPLIDSFKLVRASYPSEFWWPVFEFASWFFRLNFTLSCTLSWPSCPPPWIFTFSAVMWSFCRRWQLNELSDLAMSLFFLLYCFCGTFFSTAYFFVPRTPMNLRPCEKPCDTFRLCTAPMLSLLEYCCEQLWFGIFIRMPPWERLRFCV